MSNLRRFAKVLAFAPLLFLSGCPKFGGLMRQFGYTELKPPSQLMQPGTMVWIEHSKPFKAGVICTQAMSLGADFKPTNSPTASSSLNKAAHVKVDVGADVMALVEGKLDIRAIRTIKVELENPTIYTLTDIDVLNGIKNRDPICHEAIAGRINAGFPVTMISKALMADVVYSVSWRQDTTLDAKARLEALQGLAPHLGVSQGRVSENSITGKNLFWGVMDDVYLSKLSNQALEPGRYSPLMDPNAKEPFVLDPNEPTRLLPIDATPVISPHVDADALAAEDAAHEDP